MEKHKIEPTEALDEFYKLKNAYETNYHEKYVMPIISSNKSKREKRVQYSKIPKPECINCKRNVGTIFSTMTDNNALIRNFIAKCGNIQDPCPLNIQIQMSKREQYNQFITEGLQIIEKMKLQIIKEKNNSLFFNKDVATLFEEITEELNATTNIIGQSIESNILKNNNPEKKQLLKRLINEYGKGCILPFKQMVSGYMDNNDELLLHNSIKFYIDEMIPKLKQIQDIKYDVSMVDFNAEEQTYHLIQLPNSLENTEYFYKSDDKVIQFIRGVKTTTSSKTNTLKEKQKPKLNKTKKNKLKPIFIVEDDEPDSPPIAPDLSPSVASDLSPIAPDLSPVAPDSPSVAPDSPSVAPDSGITIDFDDNT
jgi:hypothetical protein